MTARQLLLSVEGRIGRLTFWMCLLGIGLVTFTVFIFDASGVLTFVLFVVNAHVLLAVYAKRWHDRDKSAWWILIGLVPLIGTVWTFVETGCMKGTEGRNRYGPDPLLARHRRKRSA
jgi:uncharacterized membrane protein YhaH (DUF805 family)